MILKSFLLSFLGAQTVKMYLGVKYDISVHTVPFKISAKYI